MDLQDIHSDPTINLALHTIQKSKQAIVFVNSKPSAEKTAEDISKQIKEKNLDPKVKPLLSELSEKIHTALQSPTKQCIRLAKCVKKGIAFHHAGLHAKQKELIEDAFRENIIQIICATPTLAAGLDLPAYRTILKDLRRYSTSGLNWIPTLEYLQMAGRAGRPKYDTEGQAIAIAKTDAEKDEITERYIYGEPEDIYSKLAVEPVLRMYLLSLIASGVVRSKKQIMDFFSKTFWAHQFKDLERLQFIVEKMLLLLCEFEFIKVSTNDFTSADTLQSSEENDSERITATLIGQRVAQLYIDPLTANHIICALQKAAQKKTNAYSYLQLVSNTIEMRPLPRIKVKEYESINEDLVTHEPWIITSVPTMYDVEYDDFLSSIKLASVFQHWINEDDESYILEKYSMRPGELHYKRNSADWLLYASIELAKLLEFHTLVKDITKVRVRLDYGVREELLPLLKLKNVGRVRARKLLTNKIKTIMDIRKADITTLAQILGAKTAQNLKTQLGEKVEPIKENKRKGQISLTDY